MALGKASGTPMSAPRVLIARYSAIGDCVMAAPVPSRIRRSHRDSFLVWAIEDRCADVVDSERLIDVVAVDERTKWRRQGPRSWGPKLRFWLSLRKHKFDLGLDLQGYPKTALCLAFARPRRTLSVGGKDALSRMLVPSMKGYDPSLHIVERNLAALGELGDFPGDAAPILPEYRDIRDRLRQDWPAETPLASLSVGAGHSNKAYPAEKWAEVAQGLIARGFAVSVAGRAGGAGSADSRRDRLRRPPASARIDGRRRFERPSPRRRHRLGTHRCGLWSASRVAVWSYACREVSPLYGQRGRA
ncbi:MAG: ADP-heptose:LPS heptosyltransferase [Armatimonadetes bacterium OLB18]|nr:MAG: ADP-heptose:LPS heptosyltransferase [Armatimonadetes bacterium OLB18]